MAKGINLNQIVEGLDEVALRKLAKTAITRRVQDVEEYIRETARNVSRGDIPSNIWDSNFAAAKEELSKYGAWKKEWEGHYENAQKGIRLQEVLEL
ncbi:hypothetical protein KA107_00895 [Candidatus Pacearchaeota archaeon]|nr:hypothetical protein [Candidatus Pacearchaeota archaeon]